MSSREMILANIRKNTQTKYEKPDYRSIEEHAIRHPDLIGQFTEVMKQMGGQAVLLSRGETDCLYSCGGGYRLWQTDGGLRRFSSRHGGCSG